MSVAHGRTDLLFTIASGLANASMGFSCPTLESMTNANLQLLADATRTKFTTEFWASGKALGLFAAPIKFIGLRLSDISSSNHVSRTAVSFLSSGIAATGAPPCLPPECAVVCSLRTTTAGARGRGRMYTPPTRGSVLTDEGNLDSTTRDALALYMANFFSAINSDTTNLMKVGVYSKVAGQVYPVINVQVGNVVDSQRGRRRALVEAYKTVAVTP